MTSPDESKLAAGAAPAGRPRRAGFLAALRSSRALRKAFKAWGHGSLDEAQALLEQAEGAVPESPGALQLLGQVLAEKGVADRALALSEEAVARRPEGSVPHVFRGMILLDLGREAEARGELDGIQGNNLLARALCGLLHLKEKLRLRAAGDEQQITVAFPLAARWISQVSGRLLALLEVEFLARHKAEAMEFHCSLFEPKGPAARAGEGGEKQPRRAPPKTRKECQEAVERAFRGRQHDEVVLLCRDGGPCSQWVEPGLQAFKVLSLLCLDKDQQASTFLAECLRGAPSTADFHFLQGLCHARKGSLAAAGWSFCRASRLADLDLDHITQEIIAKLNLRILFEA